MSPADRSVPLGRGPRSLLGSGLAAAAACGSLLALNGLMEPGDWLSAACTAVVLMAALTAAVRALGRPAWLPSVVGAVVGFLGIVVLYGGPRAGSPTPPTPGAAGRVWSLARQGVQLIQDSLVPMTPDRSIELIVVGAALAVFLLVDALALGSDAPALAAVPLVAFWLPAVFLGFPTNGWALFWTGLAYLLLLAMGTAPPVGEAARVRQVTAILAGAVGALVVAIVAGPVLSALPAWAAVSLPDLGTGVVGPLQLSGELDLRESLGQRSGQEVLRYVVSRPGASDRSGDATGTPQPSASPRGFPPDSRSVGPLRAFSVSDFDGRTWHRDESGIREPWSLETLLGLGPDRARDLDASDPRAVDVRVRIGGLEQSDLPISTFPRTVEVEGSWGYDPVKDEIVGRRPTSPGQEYQMRVVVPSLTADDLRTATIGDPPGDADYLGLPSTEHLDQVRAVAGEVTAEATTPYEQAMALQGYLRSAANFTYDTRVPPARSQDAVWDFLQNRRGYCVQFATAMAIMARTLDIPSRVAVGFLPGDARQDGTAIEYVVTGRQAHAWPELYFADFGWVRFEPTPAEQTGLPPIWSDPLAGAQVSGPGGPGDLEGGPGDGGTSALTPDVPLAPRGGGSASPGDWVPFAAVVGALAIGGGLTAWLVARSRRPVELTCEHAWHHLRRTLSRKAGISWSDATTPRAAVRTVRARLVDLTGVDLDGPSLAALERLASAVEQERYARRPSSPTSAELHHLLATVRHTVERRVSDRSRRGAGPNALPSGT